MKGGTREVLITCNEVQAQCTYAWMNQESQRYIIQEKIKLSLFLPLSI